VKITKQADGTVTHTEFLPLLRNHRYRINITAVKDRGYDTKEEAFAAMGINTNLEVELENSNESITNYVYDGQYYLGVSINELTIDKNGATLAYAREIDIDTNYDYSPSWKATADVSWITFVQDDGTSTGTSMTGPQGESVLKFVVDANSGTVARTGRITLQAGRLFQYIDITQTISASVEVVSKATIFWMNGEDQTFTMRTTYDWKARIANDPYNVIREFDKSGTASPSTAQSFRFVGINEVLMDVFSTTLKDQVVTFEIYSANEPAEFDPYPIDVWISSVGYNVSTFSFYIYPTDISSVTWTNAPTECAALPYGTWRVPTTTELTAIYTYVTGNGVATAWGFTTTSGTDSRYWASEQISSTNGYYVRFDTGATSNTTKASSYRARCVRDK